MANLDDQADNEIIVSTTAHPYAPTFIHLFRGLPYPSGVSVHLGNPAYAEARVVNLGQERGKVFVGVFQANLIRGAAVLVLRDDDFFPPDFEKVRAHSRGDWDIRRSSGITPEAIARTDPPPAHEPSPEYVDFDLENQPCLAYIAIPRHPAWDEVRPADTMDIASSLVLARTDESPVVCITSWCRESEKPRDDYVAYFALPDTLVDFNVNAIMANYATVLLRAGVTQVDLGSASFAAEWARMLRYYDHILWNREDEGKPLVMQ
ncbi:MAG: hypothetical protein R3E12_18405 [Candidatus Eisenbacteria bacterium]